MGQPIKYQDKDTILMRISNMKTEINTQINTKEKMALFVVEPIHAKALVFNGSTHQVTITGSLKYLLTETRVYQEKKLYLSLLLSKGLLQNCYRKCQLLARILMVY